MYTRIVTFRLDGLTAADYRDHAAAVAPAYTRWAGLVGKVWIGDDEAGTYGGVYLFVDRASADRSRDTDLYRSMTTNERFSDVSVREFSVLDGPTAVTAPALAAANVI